MLHTEYFETFDVVKNNLNTYIENGNAAYLLNPESHITGILLARERPRSKSNAPDGCFSGGSERDGKGDVFLLGFYGQIQLAPLE